MYFRIFYFFICVFLQLFSRRACLACEMPCSPSGRFHVRPPPAFTSHWFIRTRLRSLGRTLLGCPLGVDPFFRCPREGGRSVSEEKNGGVSCKPPFAGRPPVVTSLLLSEVFLEFSLFFMVFYFVASVCLSFSGFCEDKDGFSELWELWVA